ncbi:MAG: hypothetical protein ABI548_01590 [Polyangiaceae bacterium]
MPKQQQKPEPDSPAVVEALAAKRKFVARLESVDPSLIADFEEFLHGYAAPRRALKADIARIEEKYGADK